MSTANKLVVLGFVLLGCFLHATSNPVEEPKIRVTRQANSVMNKLMAGEVLTVRLKSVSTGEYLYAADASQSRDELNRGVYTWRDTKEPVGDWAEWKVTGSFTEGKFHIRLASRKYGNELLYAPSETQFLFDPERRNVYTWRSKTAIDDESADWFMETDVTDTAKHPNRYTLLNVLHREYLYAGDNGKVKDVSRRHVFTWLGVKKDFLNNKQHMWDFEVVTPVAVRKP